MSGDGHRLMLDQLSQKMTMNEAIRIGRIHKLPGGVLDKIERGRDPGIILIQALEQRRKIAERLVIMKEFCQKLYELELDHLAEKVEEVYPNLGASPSPAGEVTDGGAVMMARSDAPSCSGSVQVPEGSIFLSFPWEKLDEVENIKMEIEEAVGIGTCWFCKDRIRTGSRLYHKLMKGIADAKIMICFLSAGYDTSEDCVDELLQARQKKMPRLPVYLEDIKLKDSSARFSLAPLLYIKLHEKSTREYYFTKLIEDIKHYLSVVPGRPDVPEISDIDCTKMTLTWTPPENDGADIIGYIVERCEAGTNQWVKAHKDDLVSKLTLTVGDLREGTEYFFRVSAKNVAGAGESSNATSPTKPKPPYGPSSSPPGEVSDRGNNALMGSSGDYIAQGGNPMSNPSD